MEEKNIYQELEKIKTELEELRKKIGSTEEKSIKAMPMELLGKVAEMSKDILKQTAEIAEKTLLIVKYSAEGAVEGARKAIREKEEGKPEK
ncbi:MAG: hypothetical protein ACK4SM_03255 [Aquificaceae bacterium]